MLRSALSATSLAVLSLAAGCMMPAAAAPITPPNMQQGSSVAQADLLLDWPCQPSCAAGGPLQAVPYSVVSAALKAQVQTLSIFGSTAGAALTTGVNNVSLGPGALRSETTGSNNTAIGPSALLHQVGANENIGLGDGPGEVLTTGSGDILIGEGAGPDLTSGTTNVCVGVQACPGLTTGANNVWIGGGQGDSLSGAANATITFADGFGNQQLQYNAGWIGGGNASGGLATGGGKGAGTVNMHGYYLDGQPAGIVIQVGKLTGANFNSTADQAIALTGPALFNVDSVVFTNCSTSITAAQGGLYAAASKASPLFNTNATSGYTWLTTASRSGTVGGGGSSPTANAGISTTIANAGTIYLSLTTAQGAPATCDLYVFGRKLS